MTKTSKFVHVGTTQDVMVHDFVSLERSLKEYMQFLSIFEKTSTQVEGLTISSWDQQLLTKCGD